LLEPIHIKQTPLKMDTSSEEYPYTAAPRRFH
jgi:hypothetical protein